MIRKIDSNEGTKKHYLWAKHLGDLEHFSKKHLGDLEHFNKKHLGDLEHFNKKHLGDLELICIFALKISKL